MVGRRTKVASLARISAIVLRSSGSGGRLFGQFFCLVAQLGGLRGSERLEVVDHGGLYAGAGEDGGLYAVEELAAHGDFEGCALAASGRICIRGMRNRLGGG